MSPKRERGFTLLEILIALFIFTIVALIMTKSLHSTLTTQEATEQVAEQLAATQTALLLLSRDLEQALERPISDQEGRLEGPFLGTRSSLTLTHGGFANPDGGLQSSSLQRTRYRFEKDQLIRDTWDQLDQAPRVLPHRRILLSGIKELSFSYLDGKNVFQPFWPPDGESYKAPVLRQQASTPVDKAVETLQGVFAAKLPRAVEIRLTLQHGGQLQQIYLLPQQEAPHEPR